ncbi:SFT2 [Symbiodinium natans]|uniref:Vesicle transport protein n=1 Tax=Symbiodinium natans TaxID=878477 RepID=A0A812G6Z8_9DINO|nr:SFT2 [Symbiodinium natans]
MLSVTNTKPHPYCLVVHNNDGFDGAAVELMTCDGDESAKTWFSVWTEKARKAFAEKVTYDPVPKDERTPTSEEIDEEKGEGGAWANISKAASRFGKQVASAAEEAKQNIEKAAEKAKTADLTQQVQGWQSEVAKGFGAAADRACQAREVFAERGKVASQLAKDLGSKAATKAGEAKVQAASKAREAKDKAASVAGAAKDKLAQAGEGLKGLGSLALSPAKLAQFGGLFFVGVFLISLSFSFLPVMVIAPQKFALLFAFGSMTMLGSFMLLKGPQAFLSGMARREQLPFSIAYGVGLVGTLIATIILRSFILTGICGLLQAVGLLYFVASYVPGGKVSKSLRQLRRPLAAALLELTQLVSKLDLAVLRSSLRPVLRNDMHSVALLVRDSQWLDSTCASRHWPETWWKFSALLGAKLVSYFASAVLHLYPHQSVSAFNFWLRIDLVSICFAVWAPTSVFLSNVWLWWLHFSVACAVAYLTYALIDSDLAHESEAALQTLDRKRQIRTAVNTLFFLWCLLFTGVGSSFRGFWITGAAFYSLSLFIAPPFSRRYPAMRWHSAGLNGWHEDFHAAVAFADAAMVWMAYSFLVEAS